MALQKHNLASQNTFLVMTGFLSLGDKKKGTGPTVHPLQLYYH